MNRLCRLLRIPLRKFSLHDMQSAPITEESILPQMILKLNTESLTTYINNHIKIISAESLVFSLERSLKLTSSTSPLTIQISDRMKSTLFSESTLFSSVSLDLWAKYSCSFMPWLEDLLTERPEILASPLKAVTYVWLLEHLQHKHNTDLVYKKLWTHFHLFPKKDESEVTTKLITNKDNLLRLFQVFTVKIKNIDALQAIEHRLISESKTMDFHQLLSVFQISSELKYRLPNHDLLDTVCNDLLKKHRNFDLAMSLMILKCFATLNYKSSHLLNTISKVIETNIRAREFLSQNQLNQVSQALFSFSKLDFLPDTVFETFMETFHNNFQNMSVQDINLFAFSHSRMMNLKMKEFNGVYYMSTDVFIHIIYELLGYYIIHTHISN